MTKTFFAQRDIFHKNILEVEKKLSSNLSSVKKILADDSITMDKDSLHYLVKLLRPETSFEHSFYGLIGKSLLQAETLSGGAAKVGMDFVLPFVKNFITNEKINGFSFSTLSSDYEEFLREALESMRKNIRPPTKTDVLEAIKNGCQDKVLETTLEKAVELAGLEGKIYVEDGQQSCFVVEKKTGYIFKTETFKAFFDPSNLWESQGAKVLLVDGMIEKVSELDHLLKKSYEEKQPLVIMAKGFSEEVIATLKINHDKNTLRVLPVQVPSNLSSINLLNDIACVCDSDVVSSLKGDLISCVGWESLRTIQKTRCSAGVLTIEEGKTKNRVIAQLKMLLDKRTDNLFNEDVVALLDERIKQLSSNTVTIRLPNMTTLENQSCRVKIDTTLRSLKALLDSGTIDLGDFQRDTTNANKSVLGEVLLKSLNQAKATTTNHHIISTLTLQLVYKVCLKQSLLFVTSSGAILMEE